MEAGRRSRGRRIRFVRFVCGCGDGSVGAGGGRGLVKGGVVRASWRVVLAVSNGSES